MDYRKEYERWIKYAEDAEILAQLRSMDEAAVEDAFYCDLAFGTGGLRGVLGAGTNRMNVYTVRKATQGLANYLTGRFSESSVVIGYDSRLKSDTFSKTAAAVFAANGVRVWLYPCLMPTPCVSFAVRQLRCSAGVMITASHNPSRYNGYKVYGPDGCQITTEAAKAVSAEINRLDLFADVRLADFDAAVKSGAVIYTPEDIYTSFIEAVKGQSVLFGDEIDRNLTIIYSPLNGTGLKPVTRALREAGFTDVRLVSEQEQPDGHFPTCPYPNPEIREAMELGLKLCEETGADLLLATDPDCDRCGIAVKAPEGYRLLTGNEVGLLLLDFVCSQRIRHGRMPADPVFVKTIVTMDLAEKIAAHYGVKTVNVLTGFKFIGEVIGRLEEQGRADSFILGFEESYGYLSGSYVRDKDAVDAALLICEMFAFYKTRGISLLEKLEELFRSYGFCKNSLRSYEFEGSAGFAKMQAVMASFRKGVQAFGPLSVEQCLDYSTSLDGLPASDVLKYRLSGGSSLVIRPSGTEPKLKLYISVTAPDASQASALEELIAHDVESILFSPRD